jgi:hypothetical protein
VSEYTALVPVTVTILVPVLVPGVAPPTMDSGIGGLQGAELDPSSPDALATLNAALVAPELTDALELLCATVEQHRAKYPTTRALATPWLGTVPEVAI